MEDTVVPVVAVSVEAFQTEVLDASREMPVLVDFWAEWCTPCLAIAPVLERVAAQWVHALRVVKVEVDAGENMKLAGRYRLRGFPSVLLFRDGVEQGRFSGARSYREVLEFLRDHGVR